jgi:cell division protein FtsQ
MRAIIPFINNETRPTVVRRRSRISAWKLAYWGALATPWLLIAGVVGGLTWLIVSDGGPDSFAARMKSEALLASLRLGFEVEEVWVNGLRRTKQEEALTAIGAVRGEPILEFDGYAARERLLSLPWVKDAIVARALPNRLNILLIEREPLALWQMNQRLQVIDAEGKPIRTVSAADYADLPVMVGKGANQKAKWLLDLVAEEQRIAARLTAAVYVGERRWNIRIDHRIDVRLPAVAPAEALTRLRELEEEHGLFQRDIVAIDLRLDDRLIVRLAPGAEMSGPIDDVAPKPGRKS